MNLKKNFRRSTAILVLIIAMAVLTMSVSAASAHNDNWKRGVRLYYILGNQQYSEFYCGAQSHSATVRIRYRGDSDYLQHRVVKSAGATAKAHLEFHPNDDLDIRRSYYSHL